MCRCGAIALPTCVRKKNKRHQLSDKWVIWFLEQGVLENHFGIGLYYFHLEITPLPPQKRK